MTSLTFPLGVSDVIPEGVLEADVILPLPKEV